MTNTSALETQSHYGAMPALTILAIPTQVSVEQEQQEFTNNYIDRNYSPQLSTRLKLTQNRRQQSIFYMGESQATLELEITVQSPHDPETQLQISSRPVTLHIVDRNSQKTMFSQLIHKHRLITIPKLQDKIYEAKFELQQEEKGVYIDKVLIISAEVKGVQKPNINLKWLKQYNSKISTLYDQSVMTFLDSLEDWNVIEDSRTKYENHQRRWKVYSTLELTGLVVLSVFQLVYLRKLLCSDIILV